MHYKDFSGIELSSITGQEGAVWSDKMKEIKRLKKDVALVRGLSISNKEIKSYYDQF